MATAKALSKEDIQQMVEKYLRKERGEGRDPSPSEIYDVLAPKHEEISAMTKPQFSGGIVRLIKQNLNKEQGTTPRKRRGRKPKTVGSAGDSHMTNVSTPSTENGFGNRDAIRMAFFDFGATLVRAEDAAQRIEALGAIDEYVNRVSELAETH